MSTIKIFLILSLIAFSLFFLLDTRYLARLIPVYGQDLFQEARQHYEKGDEYYQQGRYKEAQEEFQKAISIISQAQKENESVYPEEVKEDKMEATLKGESSVKEKIPPKEGKGQISEVRGYTINEGDVLYITVWQNEDLNQEVIVRPDGMISFSLVGDVSAVGLAISQLDEELTQRLKKYVKDPVISVSIKKIGGKKIIVLGEVSNPGVYSVTGRLLEAIALANGFTQNAVLSSVIVIKGGFGNPKGIRLNLNRAINKADMSQNIALEPEDIIYVPKKFIANINYFVSQIIGPISQGVYSVDQLQNR